VSRRFADVARRNRNAVACRAGCFGCCVGLFEISPLDAALAERALARLPRARRQAIARRGEAISRRIAKIFPGDPATLRLDIGREDEWDAFFEKTAGIACPFLEPLDRTSAATAPAAARAHRWPQGFTCAIYAHRPHICRTFGLPLAERSRIVSDPCRLNFRGAPAERIAGAALPVYEPEEEAIARAAEAEEGLPVDLATILPAVASGRFRSRQESL
jgi:Fe-S-cluster containining protein